MRNMVCLKWSVYTRIRCVRMQCSLIVLLRVFVLKHSRNWRSQSISLRITLVKWTNSLVLTRMMRKVATRSHLIAMFASTVKGCPRLHPQRTTILLKVLSRKKYITNINLLTFLASYKRTLCLHIVVSFYSSWLLTVLYPAYNRCRWSSRLWNTSLASSLFA